MLGNIFRTLGISASALGANRLRMDAHIANLANRETTRTPEGGPYKAQQVVFESLLGGDGRPAGVAVSAIEESANFVRVYDPDHPDADAEGFVLYPDIDATTEVADLMVAQRALSLNVQAFQAAREMISRTLELLRR